MVLRPAAGASFWVSAASNNETLSIFCLCCFLCRPQAPFSRSTKKTKASISTQRQAHTFIACVAFPGGRRRLFQGQYYIKSCTIMRLLFVLFIKAVAGAFLRAQAKAKSEAKAKAAKATAAVDAKAKAKAKATAKDKAKAKATAKAKANARAKAKTRTTAKAKTEARDKAEAKAKASAKAKAKGKANAKASSGHKASRFDTLRVLARAELQVHLAYPQEHAFQNAVRGGSLCLSLRNLL